MGGRQMRGGETGMKLERSENRSGTQNWSGTLKGDKDISS